MLPQLIAEAAVLPAGAPGAGEAGAFVGERLPQPEAGGGEGGPGPAPDQGPAAAAGVFRGGIGRHGGGLDGVSNSNRLAGGVGRQRRNAGLAQQRDQLPLAAPPGSGSAGCAVGVVACLIDKRSLGERVLD